MMDYISFFIFPMNFDWEKYVNELSDTSNLQKNVHNDFENGYRIQTKLDK